MKNLLFIFLLFSIVLVAQPGSDLNQTYVNGGTVSTTTDGSGQVTVNHNTGSTPSAAIIQIEGANWYRTSTTKDATTITITFIDPTSETAATSAAVVFSWMVLK